MEPCFSSPNVQIVREQLQAVLQKIDELNHKDKMEVLDYLQLFLSIRVVAAQPSHTYEYLDEIVSSKGIKQPGNPVKPLSKENEKQQYKCTICNNLNKSRKGLLQHMEMKHVGTPISCLKCRHTLNSRAAFNWHISSNLCNKSRGLTKNTVSSGKYMSCKTSSRKNCSCKKKIDMLEKQAQAAGTLHSKEKCPYCSTLFETKLLLRAHLEDHKGKNTNKVICYTEQVSESYNKRKSGTPKYICDKCGKTFWERHRLNSHVNSIHGSKLFSCSYCKYQTYSKANLERHQNLHLSEENTFVCHYCGKILSTLAVLHDHVKYNHMEEKRFQCNQCHYSFKRNHELIRHKTTHSSIRPHVCKICNQGFRRLNHLHRHEATVHLKVKKTNKVQRFKLDQTGIAIAIPQTKMMPKAKPTPETAKTNISDGSVDYCNFNDTEKDNYIINLDSYWLNWKQSSQQSTDPLNQNIELLLTEPSISDLEPFI